MRLDLKNAFTVRTRRPDFWALVLSEMMSVFTYLAIYFTREVHHWPFLIAIVLTLFRAFPRFRFRTVWMVSGFLIQIFIGFQLVVRFQYHPLVGAAHLAPIALAWTGLALGSEGFWGWRMGVGFIGLILASALTPDLSILVFILAYIICGSIALACRFLSNEFKRRGVMGSLPRGFLRNGFYQSGTLLFAALLIFPLIPRVEGQGNLFNRNNPKSGYTEEVNLSEWNRVSNQGSSAPALRIYGPNGTDPSLLIPSGLLRSRVLNILAAKRWNPALTQTDLTIIAPEKITPANTLMIVREIVGPANLPVPYGTQNVSVEMMGYRWNGERTKIGEWREGRARNQRFNYYPSVNVNSQRRMQDAPTPVDLAVPEEFRSKRVVGFSERLLQGIKDPEAKIAAIHTHFMKNDFRAVYAEDEPTRNEPEDQALPPIERFLFKERSGHCELFASSMAILLRLSGVPTRLIAGFRIGRDAVGDVLTVRQSDAHAWLEAFVPNKGWVVVDPTPKVLMDFSISDWIHSSYEWASAKWAQYILNYGQGENSLAAQWVKLKKIASQISKGKNPMAEGDTTANLYLFVVIFLTGSLTLSYIAVKLNRKLRRRRAAFRLDQIKLDLIRERVRMDSVRAKFGKNRAEPVTTSIEDWYRTYEKARFGTTIDIQILRDMRARRAAIEKDLSKRQA
jgi:hypothetical protein